MKRITIFTPTFNRAYSLNQLYESLLKQSNHDFCWLIIDDGSTDTTKELVNVWMKQNKIEIRYYFVQNGGKQRAYNLGVKLCETEIFVCVDSDDYLIDDAIKIIIDEWNSIIDKSEIAGIIALSGKDSLTPLHTFFPRHLKKATLNDLYNKYKFKADTLVINRTDILTEYPFFVYEDEKFIGESYIYDQIGQKYKWHLLNKVIYICEYLPDGYSKNIKKVIKDNPKGYALLNKQRVQFSRNLKEKIVNSIKFMVGCILAKEKRMIKKSPNPIVAIIAYMPAYIYVLLKYKKL